MAAHLFAEEAVVVIATVEADVVEDAALAVDVDFIAVGSLRDADARSQRKEVFKLAPEDRGLRDRGFVQRGGRFGLCKLNNRHVGNNDLLRDRGNLDRYWN